MGLIIRSIQQADAETCGKIGFQAHKAISSAHGYPSEQPSIEFAVGMIKTLLANPNSWGALAERDGQILGSIFLHVFPPSPVAAIGPLTVDPSAEGRVGRALMEASLMEARKRGYEQVRLVQSPSHLRSFVLYTKCGFTLREPLFLMQGNPVRSILGKKHDVRAARSEDISACNEICISVHGFSREIELRQAIDQRVATVNIDNTGNITGYAAGIGFLGHAVAKSNEVLKELVANASAILGHGFFVPGRNSDLLRWLLDVGFRIVWPANLMTMGNYQDPTAPFLPSIAY
ncbi:MAG TPA: GNAT family N-acetyltransferase [Nitrososphaera sp.]|jgi:predicted N-acetyltransferase YhbS|nr:GNAT family N-acetyltransferase [Nitrososphaera sp.]